MHDWRHRRAQTPSPPYLPPLSLCVRVFFVSPLIIKNLALPSLPPSSPGPMPDVIDQLWMGLRGLTRVGGSSGSPCPSPPPIYTCLHWAAPPLPLASTRVPISSSSSS